MLTKLMNKGYFRTVPIGKNKKNNKNIKNKSTIKPTALRKLINLDHLDIIMSYNGVM